MTKAGRNMTDSPLVSVIIPVWNTGKSVKALIESLFQQSYRNLEIIAVDDGSTDDSLRILQDLTKTDKRLKVIHQENSGAGAARNRGLKNATGGYLAFVDSDDEVKENYIGALVEALEQNPKATLALTGKMYNKIHEGKSVEAFTETRRSRRKNERLSEYVIYLMILDGRMYSMTSKMFRADIVRKHKIRVDEGRDFAEDTKFTIDYLAAQDGEIVFIPEALYVYNFGTETSLVQKSSLVWENWDQSYRELEAWARSENEGRLSARAHMLLELVRLRWHISHYKAKRRAQRIAH